MFFFCSNSETTGQFTSAILGVEYFLGAFANNLEERSQIIGSKMKEPILAPVAVLDLIFTKDDIIAVIADKFSVQSEYLLIIIIIVNNYIFVGDKRGLIYSLFIHFFLFRFRFFLKMQ